MRFIRIVHLNLGRITVTRDRFPSPVGQGHRDEKVVLADENARDLLAVCERHGHGRGLHILTPAAASAPTPSATRDPGVLERPWIRVLGSYALQVAADRMASAAFRLKIGLSGGYIADENVQRGRIDGSGRASLVPHLR